MPQPTPSNSDLGSTFHLFIFIRPDVVKMCKMQVLYKHVFFLNLVYASHYYVQYHFTHNYMKFWFCHQGVMDYAHKGRSYQCGWLRGVVHWIGVGVLNLSLHCWNTKRPNGIIVCCGAIMQIVFVSAECVCVCVNVPIVGCVWRTLRPVWGADS